MEPQQSSLYAKYISDLGWKTTQINGVYIYFRRIPMLGGILKVHRPPQLPDPHKLTDLICKNHIRTFVIEPAVNQDQKKLASWCRIISRHVKISKTPYLPTKTIRVDLLRDEETIFRSFSEAKRRAVRKAIKNGVVIEESADIRNMIAIKNKSAGLFGSITTYGIDKFWDAFGSKYGSILLAYSPSYNSPPIIHNSIHIGGVLLLFWNNISYYWLAGATHEGKRLFTPTLLVWEAIRLSKKRNMRMFDFLGVWDERLPRENRDWLGFTKFKEGFGGTHIFYPLVPRSR
jgi:hypothetical protein